MNSRPDERKLPDEPKRLKPLDDQGPTRGEILLWGGMVILGCIVALDVLGKKG